MSESIFQTSDCGPRSLEETSGSHYALQVALQTMKERCHQLQVRLSAVEDENIQLRVKRDALNEFTTDPTLVAISELQDMVSKLTRQKSQLMHRECMVTEENQKLWNRLAQLTKANKSLGGHLTKISKSISEHEIGSGKPVRTSSPIKAGAKDLSMDEIHLKPGASLIQENAELGVQYQQMVESIKSSIEFPIQNLGFSYMDQEVESTMKEINKQCEKLQSIKTLLADQQSNLKFALKNHEQTLKGKIECQNCADRVERARNPTPSSDVNETVGSPAAEAPYTSQVVSADHRREEKPEDHICPMCGKFYPKLRPFDDFLHHVSSHFEEQDTVLNGYEVVT